MNYIKVGEGKDFVVFLHGWAADLNSFYWLKNIYNDKVMLFVDFAGFGKTPEPTKPYFVSDYVVELKQLLDSFEIESLYLVGHSFGGRVAIKYSCFYQNCYTKFKLCLIDSAGVIPRRNLIYYYKVWKYKRLKKKANNSIRTQNMIMKMGSNDYKKLSKIMKQTFVNVVNEDLIPYAKHIKTETKLIWGEKDKETKIYMAKKLNRAIKNSKLYILEKAGHFSFLDNKSDFLILLDTFIKN